MNKTRPAPVLRPRSVRPQRRVRRGAALSTLLGVFVLTGILGTLGWWAYTRPVAITITAEPNDAFIASLDATATGTLSLANVRAGAYEVLVKRAGFETLRTSIDVARFGDNHFRFRLTPLPQRFNVSVKPSSAVCRVLDASGADVARSDGSLTTTLPSGPYTLKVAADGRNTYTRELFLDAPYDLQVWLDPAGQLVQTLGMMTCAGAPKGVRITPDGREAWATILDGPPAIEIFDMETLRSISAINIGNYGAVEIAFSRDGAKAYVSQMQTAKVFEIDTATRTVVRALPTESAWTKVVSLSPDEATLYAANWSGNDVSEIDLSTGTLRRRIRTADTPRGLWPTPDGSALYVACFGGGELQRIDLASGDVTTVFDSNGALRHLVGDAKRGVLYASDMAKDCVWIHDLATGATKKFVNTDAKPNTIALSPDGSILFVSCRGANNPRSYYIPGPEWGTVLLFDAKSATPLDAIVGGNQCTALDISGDGRKLVFSDFLDFRLRAYHVPAHKTLIAGGKGRWEQHFTDLRK